MLNENVAVFCERSFSKVFFKSTKHSFLTVLLIDKLRIESIYLTNYRLINEHVGKHHMHVE